MKTDEPIFVEVLARPSTHFREKLVFLLKLVGENPATSAGHALRVTG
jgi:hypothetical protein